MYITGTKAQILIPKFPLATTVSWLLSRCKVRLSNRHEVPSVTVLCLCFCVHPSSESAQKEVFGSREDLARSLVASETGGSLVRLSAEKFREHLGARSLYKAVLQF